MRFLKRECRQLGLSQSADKNMMMFQPSQGSLLVFHCTRRERNSPTRCWWQIYISVNEPAQTLVLWVYYFVTNNTIGFVRSFFGVYCGKRSAVVGCFFGHYRVFA